MNVENSDTSSKTESFTMLFALVIGYFVGVQGIALLPFWVGISVEGFGMAKQMGGYLATVQLGIATFATLLLSVRIDTFNKRSLYIWGALISLAGNIMSLLACRMVSVEMLFVGRLIAGLGEGLIVATVSAVAASTVKPIRSFAFMNGGMAVTAGLVYMFSPYAIAPLGALGIYLIMACFAAACPLFAFLVPRLKNDVHPAQSNTGQPKPVTKSRMGIRAWTGLTAYALYTCAGGGVWVYAERVGTTVVNLELAVVGRVMALAAFLFVLGPYIANQTGNRFGRHLPVVLSCIGYLFVAMGFSFASSFWSYAIAVIGHAIVAGYYTTYAPALFAEVDPSGRVAAASPAFYSLGNAAGPSAMAFAMPFFSGYLALGWVALLLLTLSCAGLIFMVNSMSKGQENLAATVDPA